MFFGLDLLLANFDQDRLGLPGRKRNLNLPGLFWLLLLDIAVEAVLLLVLLQSAFLLLGFPAYFCEFVGLGAVEAGVVEVALGVALAYLVEIIHVELGEGGSTWRTKEE